MKTKRCCKCKETKNIAEFNKNTSKKDNLSTECKSCTSVYKKIYEKNNIDKLRAKRKEYYNEHKDDILDYHKRYDEENIERIQEYKSNYYKKNKRKILERAKEYRKNNKEIIKERDRTYNITHKSKRQEIKRRRRAKKLEVCENYTNDDEQYTRNLFGNMCANCGSTDNLCIDHHKPLSKGNALSRDNAVVLCISCNSSKHDKLPEDFYTEEKFTEIEQLLHITTK